MRKQRILNVIMRILVFYGLFYVVSDLWRLLEMIVYKNVKPNLVDLVVGLLFSFSLYKNLLHLFRKRAK